MDGHDGSACGAPAAVKVRADGAWRKALARNGRFAGRLSAREGTPHASGSGAARGRGRKFPRGYPAAPGSIPEPCAGSGIGQATATVIEFMPPSSLRPVSGKFASWRRVLAGVGATAERSHLPLISAGVAFFGLMAAIPGLAALIALVGILGEPGWVGEQVRALRGLAPDAVVSIIYDQVERLLEAADQPLLAGAVFNLLLAIWSALQGTRWVLVALSAINVRAPPRKFLQRYVAAGQFTLFVLFLSAIAIALLGVAPVALELAPLGTGFETALLLLRWPVLGGCALGGLLVLYRWGPTGPPPAWRHVWPGALLAPAAWVAASSLLTFALREFPAFGAAYGALASVVALLLWLYLSALIFLLGAALNAELQQLSEDEPG